MQLPKAFISAVQNQFGVNADQILHGYIQEPVVSIRINPAKITKPNLAPIAWCEDGFMLPTRPTFTGDPFLHAGAYYVQEASSMLIGNVTEWICKKIIVRTALDCCASPGGKSTHLRTKLPKECILVSNEFEGKRVPQLIENLLKWGGPPPLITNTSVLEIATDLPETFDFILIDAPCSGEGLFRKQPDYIQKWSDQIAPKCAVLQREIVANAWQALKPGGYLVYSTCTLNKLENSTIIQHLKSHFGACLSDYIPNNEWNLIADEAGGFYSLPGFTCGEPFYFCVLRKPGKHNTEANFEYDESYSLKNTQYIIHSNGLPILTALSERVIRLPGYPLNSEDYPETPSHALVLQPSWVCPFPEVELSHTQAIQYLQRNALHIESDRGTVRLNFQGLPLGLGKSVGNRINNLYPKQWRIINQRIGTEFTIKQFLPTA